MPPNPPPRPPALAPASATPASPPLSYSATEDTPVTIPAASGLLSNFSAGGANRRVSSVTVLPATGNVTFTASGDFTFTPAANAAGARSFTFLALWEDDCGATQNATVTVTMQIGGPPGRGGRMKRTLPLPQH